MKAAVLKSPDDVSLAEQAYTMLEEQLVTLALEPGSVVAEKDLVERVGIGRTPVREAIQKFSAQGLLQVLPRKGLVVTPLRRSDLLQIIETRRVLERLMVVKAAERASQDQRRALRILAAHLETAGNDLDGFFRLDRRLDELLGAACANRYLVRALAAMRSQCRRLWYRYRQRLDLPQTAALHAGLARSVADRDGAGAIRAADAIIAIVGDLVDGLDRLT